MRATIALVALALAGCAMDPYVDPVQFEILDQESCVSWGAALGTPQHAECRTALTQQRTAAIQERTARQATIARIASGSAPARSSRSMPEIGSTRIQSTCFARGETVSGMNKICHYDCMGSGAAITQSAVSLCPLTIRQ